MRGKATYGSLRRWAHMLGFGGHFLTRVPRIPVHGTRRVVALLLVALDVHPRVAMRILRHSKIDVTMEIYADAPSEATCEALRKLSDLLAA
ncbi:MAG: hypothetical protein J2P27_14490 [Actinobacteria bacterium]|nr:hypothetical protein [Actinomycetota bacterium]